MKNRRRIFIFTIAALALILGGIWRWNVDRPFEELRASVDLKTSPPAKTSGQIIISIGAFDNPDLENRVPSFPTTLTTHFTSVRDSAFSYVDRKRATNSPPADWVLGGFYATPAPGKIQATLRLERIRGGEVSFKIEGAPGEAFQQQIQDTIAHAITEQLDKAPFYQTRRTESDLLCEQGAHLCEIPYLNFTRINPFEANGLNESESARRSFRLQQAIRALECSLSANPTNAQAKVYLGICYESAFINRARDARRLYREVIATPLHDRWAHAARLRLARNYEAAGDPKHALDLLRKAEDEAPDAESAALFRKVGDAIWIPAESANPDINQNQRVAFLESLDRTVNELQQTKPLIGSVYFDSISAGFSSIKDDDARRKAIFAFAQELKPRYPALYPYMLLDNLADAIKLPTWKSEVQSVVSAAVADTNTVARPEHFFHHVQNAAKNLARHDCDFALFLLQSRDAAESKGFASPAEDETRVLEALILGAQEKWKEALDCLEKVGNRTAAINYPDPWGNRGFRYVSAPALAERCRAKLGAASPHPGFIHEAGKAIFVSDERPFIAFEENKIWFGDSTRLIEASSTGEIKKQRTLTLPAPASALVVISNYLYVGTQGAGLIRLDKTSLTQNRYGADGQLLSDHITELRHIDGKLWIGYGAIVTSAEALKESLFHERDFGPNPSGAIGYLDLAKFKFTNFVPVKTHAASHQIYYENEAALHDNSPPNLPVLAIDQTPDGSIYAAVHLRGVQRFEPSTNRWSTIRLDPDTAPSALAISGEYFCAGERSRSIIGTQRNAVWIRRVGEKQFHYFTTKEGLPSDDVTALALDGDKLWIGGPGFVALLDLRETKLLQIISHPCPEVIRIARAGTNLWIATNDRILTLPL